MEHFEEGARRLEALAPAMAAGTSAAMRAEVLAQAGQAWLRAGNLDRAFTVQTEALTLERARFIMLGCGFYLYKPSIS